MTGRFLAVMIVILALTPMATAQDQTLAQLEAKIASLEAKLNAGQAGPSVAVIELDSVARAMGKDQVIQSQLQAKEQDLRNLLSQREREIGASFQSNRERIEREVAAGPAQQEQVGNLLREAQGQIQRERMMAQQERAIYQAKLVEQFREEVRPHAQKVAADRGFTVVLTRSETVFIAAPTTDITAEVIAAMTAAAPSTAPAAGN